VKFGGVKQTVQQSRKLSGLLDRVCTRGEFGSIKRPMDGWRFCLIRQSLLFSGRGGNKYKEIGDKLKIGVAMVRTYVKGICHKIHVRNRLEAMARQRAELH
jgi:hypothetical protein